jgi:hypothetical protein
MLDAIEIGLVKAQDNIYQYPPSSEVPLAVISIICFE